jgi:hypothetical protein
LGNNEERREKSIKERASREFKSEEFPAVRMQDESQGDQSTNATEKDI